MTILPFASASQHACRHRWSGLPWLLLLSLSGGLSLSCGFYTDRDGDGTYLAPEFQGSRLYDCDDQDPLVGAGQPFYLDADGDLLGDGDRPCFVCPTGGETFTALSEKDNPEGCTGTYVFNALDCRDSGEGAATWGLGVWLYQDADQDGLGDPSLTLAEYACIDEVEVLEARSYVLNALDCDDGSINIGAATSFYVDQDGDSFGTEPMLTSCADEPVPPEGYVTRNGDCDDLRIDTWPGAPDCSAGNQLGHDESCDGRLDEDLGRTWYLDDDGDGWGRIVDETATCPASLNGEPDCSTACPAGDSIRRYVRQTGDCQDDDAAVFPGEGC